MALNLADDLEDQRVRHEFASKVVTAIEPMIKQFPCELIPHLFGCFARASFRRDRALAEKIDQVMRRSTSLPKSMRCITSFSAVTLTVDGADRRDKASDLIEEIDCIFGVSSVMSVRSRAMFIAQNLRNGSSKERCIAAFKGLTVDFESRCFPAWATEQLAFRKTALGLAESIDSPDALNHATENADEIAQFVEDNAVAIESLRIKILNKSRDGMLPKLVDYLGVLAQ